MAKLKNEFSKLPTVRLRSIVWTRTVKKALLPNKDSLRPHAHLIEPELMDFISRYNKRSNKSGMQSFDDVAVSRGRWMDWWGGSQPSPSKIKSFSKVSPNSEQWFTAQISYYPENPIHSLLYAIDLWASKTDQRNKAYGLIFAIEKTWRPRLRKKLFNNIDLQGWAINAFPDKHVPSELANEYHSLEPSSLIKFMLLIGDRFKIDETDYFERWIFDLAAIALATRAILNPNFEEASFLGGGTVDLSTMIERMFVTKNSHFRNKQNAFEYSLKNNYKDLLLLVSVNFYDIIRKSTILINTKLSEVGIKEEDVNRLNAQIFWVQGTNF